jgi:hypothetical protein
VVVAAQVQLPQGSFVTASRDLGPVESAGTRPSEAVEGSAAIFSPVSPGCLHL